MRTDLIFYEPHEQARKKPRPAMPIPQLSLNHEGRFRFNQPGTEMLGLQPNSRVVLGHRRDDPREWFLRVVHEGGHALANFNANTGAPGQRISLGFRSAALRRRLLETLPHAPASKLLTFTLDALTILEEDGGEIWPLMTAPYYVPPEAQAPKPVPYEPPVHRRVLAMTIPGLLGVLHQADLP